MAETGIFNRVIVVGGGAAGIFAAITCAAVNSQAQVLVLEAGREPLAKVRISGGGRCNVTHHCFDPALLVQSYPRGSRALRGPFSRFQPQDTVDWFTRRGVALKTEADGRMFPTTDDSETIIDCLLGETRRLGVQIRTGAPVRSIQKNQTGFQVGLTNREQLTCDRLLLATGSSPAGYRWAEQFGHTIVPPVPSLFTFNIADAPLRELAGVTVESVKLTLRLEAGKPLVQTGPLLITHWGLSGPAVLKLSAYGAVGLHTQGYRAQLAVNWLPDLSPQAVQQQLETLRQQQGRRPVAAFSPFPLPRRLWQYGVIHQAGLESSLTWANLSKSALQQLVRMITQTPYTITGKGAFKEEFVTCGGVKLNQVDFKTMESRVCPGLYLAGELLDIDAITGGFNFQNAWTTGWLAGQALGQGSV